MKNLILVFILTFSFTTEANLVQSCVNFFKKIKKEGTSKSFSKAFPNSVKTAGNLSQRADDLVQKWPNNMKVVESVNLKFEHNGYKGTGSKKMLVISLDGLDQTQEKDLLKDYVDYLSHKTISFPLNERAGHLHTRLGNKDLDFLSGLSQNEYRWPSSERLETFIELGDQEFYNVRQYVENTELTNVLGSFSYQGVKNEIGGATIAKNFTSGEGHNCTSWIGLAPIGDNNKSLRNLVGAQYEYHTNPGWWTAYLQTKASSERVPIVAYVTRKPMNEAIEKTEKSFFEWDFDLH